MLQTHEALLSGSRFRVCFERFIRDFPKIRGTLLWVLLIRMLLFRGNSLIRIFYGYGRGFEGLGFRVLGL